MTHIRVNSFKIAVNPLTIDYIEPKYAKLGDSGMDLFCREDFEVEPNKAYLVELGYSIRMPEANDNFRIEAQIRSKSGNAAKHGLFVLNSPGTVDNGYEGELKVLLFNLGDKTVNVKRGDAVAQMVFCPIFIAQNDTNPVDEPLKSRGIGGFGSSNTGVKDVK